MDKTKVFKKLLSIALAVIMFLSVVPLGLIDGLDFGLKAKAVSGQGLVNYFHEMATVKWTAGETFQAKVGTGVQTYHKGQTYYGLPYAQNGGGVLKLETFKNAASAGSISKILGWSDCSTSLGAAFKHFFPSMIEIWNVSWFKDSGTGFNKCGTVGDYSSLMPGDVLVKSDNSHVMLVASVNKSAKTVKVIHQSSAWYIYNSGTDKTSSASVSTSRNTSWGINDDKSYSVLSSGGYQGYRFNGLDTSVNYYLDVNLRVDNVNEYAGHESTTFDVTVNGTKVANDVKDYRSDQTKGTTYTVNDIKVSGCYKLSGNSSYSGTLNANTPIYINVVSNHKWNSGTVTEEATCTASGKKIYTCSTCGSTKTETISQLGHNYKSEFIAPTETKQGYTLYTCSRCEDSYKDNYVTYKDGWFYCDELPSEITASDYTIEYSNYYEKIQENSPGSDWTKGEVVKSEWVNSGDPYVRYTDEATSDSKVLVNKTYYHYCGPSTSNYANYELTAGKYVHYDSVDPAKVNANYAGDDVGHSYYILYWKSNGQKVYCQSGVTCDGSYGAHGQRSFAWYVRNTYQNRVKVTTYKYTKTSAWSSAKDASATKVNCRYKPNAVAKPLKITTQPKNLAQAVGTTAKFTVAATGTGTLGYQWKVSTNGTSWTNSKMTGYNTATLQVPVKADKNGYKFKCVVTDANGSVTSSMATLTVKESTVKITAQPKSLTQEVGTTAKFTVNATGSGTISCQWKVSTDGTNWTNSKMTGYNTPTLKVPVKADKNGYKFKCVVTDANGSVTSSTATLTVIKSTAKITTQPKSVTQTTGTTAKFTVAATGSGTLSYQWKVSTDGINWTNSKMTGYNTATLQVPVKADKNGYKFMCVVTDANGSVKSSTATLTVIKSTAKITAQPNSVIQSAGTTAKFTVAVTGSGTLSYQWKVSTDGVNWTNSKMTGYNTNTLQVPVKADKDGYKFICVVTDANGSVTSSAATLTVA